MLQHVSASKAGIFRQFQKQTPHLINLKTVIDLRFQIVLDPFKESTDEMKFYMI